MNIIFKNMEMHNFISYSDESFDFSKQKGMNLICGTNLDIPGSKNACGKSSLCHALVYALYGQLPFKLKNENIINRYIPTKDMHVSIVFDVGKKHYKVISGLHGKQSYCDVFEINKGEEKTITKSTMAETRKFIENDILKCDLGLFMRTIMLNSDPLYNFYNLSKADKTEFINKLFDIKLFGDMYDLSHKDKLAMEKEITVHNSKLMIYKKNDEDFNQKKSEFEERVRNDRIELQNTLSSYQEKLNELMKTSVSQNKEETDNYKEKKEKVLNKITSENFEIKNNNVVIKSLERGIMSFESQIKKLSDIIEKHGVVKNKLCDDCQIVFSKHYKLDQYNSEIEKIKESIESDKKKIDELKKKNAEISKTIKKYNDIVPEIEKRIKIASSAYEEYTNNINSYNTIIKNTIDKIKELDVKQNPYENLISENKANMETEESELKEVTKMYKRVVLLEGIVKHDNLKKMIIKDMIGVLNNKIKYYLHKQGANYDIVFDEEMNYDFITKSNRNAEFHNFSSGEQARISISTCFAFRDFLSVRSNISSNILLIDEFIDSNIDTMAIESILEILNDFVKVNKQNVFIISHRNEVKDNSMFNRIIEVEKKDNISHLKYVSNR